MLYPHLARVVFGYIQSLGWKRGVIVLMLLWEHMMGQKCMNWLASVIFNTKKVWFKKYWAIKRWQTSHIKKCKWTSFRKKKTFAIFFQQKGLQIIRECNLKVVNYLDITLNLNDGSYQPYRKPNAETHYIHIQSDHPPSITKQLPRSIEKRLSQL